MEHLNRTNRANDNKCCGSDDRCYKGYCMTYCNISTCDEASWWCYTTKGSSMDYNDVKCEKDSECNHCWKCARPCRF